MKGPALFVILVLFGCMICLFPVGLYCLALAQINARRSPSLIAGTWDFVGVLAALSGFLLFGPSVTALAFQSSWRRMLARADFAGLRDTLGDNQDYLLRVLLAYAVTLLAAVGFVLHRRRRIATVYNVEAGPFHTALAESLERLGLPFSKRGSLMCIGSRTAKPSLVFSEAEVRSVSVETSAALIEVDYFAPMRHGSLTWVQDTEGIRPEVERELASVLSGSETVHNPAAGWLYTVSTCLFVTFFFCVILLVVGSLSFARGR